MLHTSTADVKCINEILLTYTFTILKLSQVLRIESNVIRKSIQQKTFGHYNSIHDNPEGLMYKLYYSDFHIILSLSLYNILELNTGINLRD